MEEALLAGKAPIRRLRPSSKGGFRTLPFILVNQALEKMSWYGIMPNMILYLTGEYGMGTVEAAKVLFRWSAATHFLPLVGAFVADSYSGRFLVVGLGSSISLLGMLFLWSTTIFPQARPQCDKTPDTCQSPTPNQLFLLYSFFALTAVGAGGVRSSCLAFAADQLKTTKVDGDGDMISGNGGSVATSALGSLLNWYFISLMVGLFIAQTCLVYIQTSLGWEVGFGVPVALMALSVVLFFVASPFYVKLKGDSGLVAGLGQVVVAAFRNRHIDLSKDQISYHREHGSYEFIPSDKLSFLNKACAISNPQEDLLTLTGTPRNPWKLCTVRQVEDLKSLVRVLPIWSTGIALSVTTSQTSFIVLQAKAMDRRTFIPGFEIPAGSYGVFAIISFVAFLVLYNRVFVPIASRVRGKPFHLGLMQRMGTGLALSVLSMAALSTTEYFRRQTSNCPEKTAETCTEMMSAMWLLPHMILGGVSEAMSAIAQNEFFYMELPKTMSSIATTLFGLGMAAASLLASWIVSALDSLTGGDGGGGGSWVSGDIDHGHLDYYYWLITCISFVNVLWFVWCSRAYGECTGEDQEEE